MDLQCSGAILQTSNPLISPTESLVARRKIGNLEQPMMDLPCPEADLTSNE